MATASPNPTGRTPAGQGGSRFDATIANAGASISMAETIHLALDSFRASKIRFLLTMLGMIIGSASIVLVVTVGLTGKNYALDQISNIGPNMIEMQYVGGTVAGPDNTSTPDSMTQGDMQAVLDQVPGIIASSPMVELHDRISMGSGITKDSMMLGVSPEYKQVRSLKVLAGRFFDDQDAASHAKVTVIVEPLAQALFGTNAQAIGQQVAIFGIPFTVIGVFKESTETFGMSEVSDQTLLIPYPVARYVTGTDVLKQIFFTVGTSKEVAPARDQILDIIRRRHRATSVYNAFTLSQVLAVMARIADSLTIVLTVAAFFTILVSGVGIANSMLANVQARTREIGIRKALGATSYEIRLQFLTEAVFLSLCGGLVGTVLGLAVPLTVDFLTPYQIPVSWWSGVIALLTSFLVGVISGTIPANRAAALDPVETLKYE